MKQAKEIGNLVNEAMLFGKSKLDSVFGNETFTLICKVLVVLYAAFCVQKLPMEYSKLVENIVVRFALLLLIAFITMNDPVLGLLLAVAFVLTIQVSNKNKLNAIVSDNHNEKEEPAASVDAQPDTFVDGNGDDHEADKTMTDNLNSSNVTNTCSPQQDFFTDSAQLHDVQSDTVDGSNQMDQVQTWEQQLGPQGMNPPYGYDGDSPAEF